MSCDGRDAIYEMCAKSTNPTIPERGPRPYLGEWMECGQPKLQMHSILTEWNNNGLLTEGVGVVMA